MLSDITIVFRHIIPLCAMMFDFSYFL